ncbi:MAG: class I SAM-dependent methyltransferase [Candidatus Rokubacteria bacterium]|nr:class I SAM-dependent methyltransferase [Candidatus Rokubacteria bacterium]
MRRILDIACGTGPHLLRFARRGYEVIGLDISRENLSYVAKQAQLRGLDVTITAQNMAGFRLGERVDAAFCLQNSQAYLLTNDAILQHFRAVARAMRPGGLYIFDRYLMSSWRNPVRRWTWSRIRGPLVVRATFSALNDVDPVSQTCREWLALEAVNNRRRIVYRQALRSRIVFPQELRALVELVGAFEFVGWFSNFSLRRPLERARGALMMITVLRRI